MTKRRESPKRAAGTGSDDDLAITGENPPAYMLRFVSGLGDYNPEERRQTVGLMRTVALAVLVVSALLIGMGFLLL